MTPFVRYLWSYAVHRNGRLAFDGTLVNYAGHRIEARASVVSFLNRCQPGLLSEPQTGVTLLESELWETVR